MARIDTHQHLLLPEKFDYPWTATFEPLRGRFGLDDYRRAAGSCDIAGTVFMEVDVAESQIADEALYFCRLAETPANGLLGVVASGRPEHADFLQRLEGMEHPALKGIRRVLHVVPDAVSEAPLFRQNVAALAARDLSFDLCLRAEQLPLAAALIDACPDTRFMLDHCGSPPLAQGPEAVARWRAAVADLAGRPRVHVKLSGLVNAVPRGTNALNALRPVVDHLLACFGPARMVWGGDWPVCDLASDLAAWCGLSDRLLAPLSPAERDLIFHSNALNFYRLSS